MRTFKGFFHRYFFLFLAICLSTLGSRSFGAGTVTNFNETALLKAFSGGGTVSFAGSGIIVLTNTLIVTQNTVLDANSNSVTISGGNATRLFQVNSNVTFQMRGLTLADGAVVGTNGANGSPPLPGEDVEGAAILNVGGTLILTGCTLTNHHAQGGNAGSYPVGTDTNFFATGGHAIGGTICSLAGQVNLTNCVISECTCLGGEGSFDANFVARNARNGDGGQAFGGAIYCEQAQLSLDGVSFINNSAVGGSSGNGWVYAGVGGQGSGGAIYASNCAMVITSSTFTTNQVSGGEIVSYILQGIAGGDGLGGALFVSPESQVSIRLSTFDSNFAGGGNGAGKFSASGVGRGGAVFNAGDAQIWTSSFSGNVSVGGSVSSSAGAGQGGALDSIGSLSAHESLFVGNSAIGGSAVTSASGWTAGAGEGGAVWSSGDLSMTNSTLTANRTSGGVVISSFGDGGPGGAANGGGMCIGGGTADLVNLTVAANRVDGTNQFPGGPPGPMQGAGLFNTNGTIILRGSIVAENVNGGDAWGSITDAGYNLCSDGTANFTANGSLNHADPMLSALSGNGGPTPTMALLAGSPARDVIPSGFPATDQRGVLRPQGPAADMGAFEADFISSRPAIVTQPQGATVRAGTNFGLIVGASGTSPLYYQWLKNGNPLGRATNSTFALTNVQAADAGVYTVLVTNTFGTATSQGAPLIVDSKPLILAQPVSTVVAPGAPASFSLSADGPSLVYQWWHNGLAVSSGTNATLQIGAALAGAQGSYFAVVSNFAGVATSIVATLSFDASALNILVAPKDVTVQAGYPASFSVLVSGIPPFAYQWAHDGKPIAGATASSLTMQNVDTNSTGGYDVIVTNDYARVVSTSAELTVTTGVKPPGLTPGMVGNSVTITFDAEAGRTYRLLSSTNLTVWSSVATNSTVLAGSVQFVRPITAAPLVFYRVVTQ